MDEAMRIVEEGMKSSTVSHRGAWVNRRESLVRAMADQAMADEPAPGDKPVSMAAEPRRPELAPEYAEPLFEAVMYEIAWQNVAPTSSLSRLLYYGIEPQRVLGRRPSTWRKRCAPTARAISMPEAVARPGRVPGSP